MYQKGQIDATTAMQMLVDLSAPVGLKPCDKGNGGNVDGGSSKRKPSPHVPSESDEDDDHAALENEVDAANMDSMLDQDMMSISTYQPSYFYLPIFCCKDSQSNRPGPVSHSFLVDSSSGASKETKVKNALKAKLRRLCELKKGKKLQVPEWLHKKWLEEKGNHREMALAYKNANFDKDLIPQFKPSH